MTVRVEVVTPCTHCEGLGTRSGVPFLVECSFCNGSGDEDRRTFTEWPPEAIEAAGRAFRRVVQEMEYADDPTDAGMDAAMAAAWGHITEGEQ